jgi:tRNA(Phe) wybutosine-synthesizing methylase Tyw3
VIIKFNCSTAEFNELFNEKNKQEFDKKIIDIFDTIESNDNVEIDESNFLEYNTPNYFYLSIDDLEKIINNIKEKNSLLDDETIVELLEHCNNTYNLGKLVNSLELA